MTQPIGSGFSRGYEAWGAAINEQTDRAHQASSPAGNAARNMCLHADTVLEGYLCDEPLVTANACRTPKNEFDAFVCDDKKMKGVQDGAWDVVKGAVKTILEVFVGRSVRP